MDILEINKKGKKVSILKYSQDTLEKLDVQRPNMLAQQFELPLSIENALHSTILPSFIANQQEFENTFGKGAKYYPYLKANEYGSKLFVLVHYQINSTNTNQSIFNHSVLFCFSKDGKLLSEKDLGAFQGADIDVSSDGFIYISLNHLQTDKQDSKLVIFNHVLQQVKALTYKGESILSVGLHKDDLYVVTSHHFYFAPKENSHISFTN
jgi:hypothetical protein